MKIVQWQLNQANILVTLEGNTILTFPQSILHGFKDFQKFVEETSNTHSLSQAQATHIANLLILLKEDQKILALFEGSLREDIKAGYTTEQQFQNIMRNLNRCYIYASEFDADNAWTNYRGMGAILSQQYTDRHLHYGLKGALIGALLGALSLFIFGLAIASCATPWAFGGFIFINMAMGASGGFLIGSTFGTPYIREKTALLTNLSIFKSFEKENDMSELTQLGLQKFAI